MTIRIGDYFIGQDKNKIVISLPQTNETLSSTIASVSGRKVWASEDDLIKLLTTAIAIFDGENDYETVSRIRDMVRQRK